MGTSRGASLPPDAVHKFPNLTRYLRIAETSLRIGFVLLLFLTAAGAMYLIGKAVNEEDWPTAIGGVIAAPLNALILWLWFLTCMAALELAKVFIRIEDNTSRK
ncbi:MAG: hypothetical protein R3C49_26375 [Planctomycetaceae bacterium]